MIKELLTLFKDIIKDFAATIIRRDTYVQEYRPKTYGTKIKK